MQRDLAELTSHGQVVTAGMVLIFMGSPQDPVGRANNSVAR